MRTLSIRASLTAWFVGSTVLLLGAFAVALYLLLGNALHDGLDERLGARAETLVALCEWEEDIGGVEFEFTEEVARGLAAGHPGHGLEVWSPPGSTLLHRSGVPLPPPTAAPPEFATIEGDDPLRLHTWISRGRTTDAGPPFDVMIRISESLAPVRAQLARTGWLIALLATLATVLVLVFGSIVSRRFVAPLRRLESAAAGVRGGARAPMPRRGSDDELDRLATVLDDAFGRLEDAVERQARFTADAAHELRNPIAVIRNAADVALRSERTGDEYREFLGDVLATARRLGDVVDALLLLARIDAGAAHGVFEPVDLAAIAREAAVVDARVRVRAGDVDPVHGEPRLLRVLVDNLLSNALRHCDADHPVEVEVARNGDGHVLLSVHDHGPGIAPESRPRLFDRFYRGEDERAGTGAGLGLAIVAEVARAHGARCEVMDGDGGTRFRVHFPRRA